ncbi:MAG: hypothetical protein M5U29_05680 [Anaerolineae bacterium]|nr:hypothetical protein [Anaerolineae bacterium]
MTTSGIWIGFNFNAVTEPSVFLCSDENGPGGAIAGLTSTDGGATWVGLTTYWPGGKAMAIRAEGEVFVPDDEEPLVPVPGPDMVPIPETAVVGSVLADTPAYYAPQADAQTGITIAAGKTLWVYGVDASGTFYKVMLSGQFFWLPTSVMGPNYDEVWQGSPLPPDVVE